MTLFLIFILSLCASQVTSIDQNVPREPFHTEDRIGNVEADVASIKADMVEVKAEITSLSADMRILTMNMMAVLKELETKRNDVYVDRKDEEFLDDKALLLNQRAQRLESQMATFNKNI